MENKNELVLLALGDIILGEDSPKFMEGVRPALKEADIRIGQLEVPYTTPVSYTHLSSAERIQWRS